MSSMFIGYAMAIQKKSICQIFIQGTERKLLLIKTDEATIKVENVSGDKWVSQFPYEYVNIEELQKYILHFVHKIKAMVARNKHAGNATKMVLFF